MPPAPAALPLAILGDSRVGKTTFVDMFLHGTVAQSYDPTSTLSTQRLFTPPNNPPTTTTTTAAAPTPCLVTLTDIDTTPFSTPSPDLSTAHIASTLSAARGIILLYSPSSRLSFDRVTNRGWAVIWACRPPGTARFGGVLVGNVRAGEEEQEREVERAEAADWAASQGLGFCEVDCMGREGCEGVVGEVVRRVGVAGRMDLVEGVRKGGKGRKGGVLRRVFRRTGDAR